MTSHEKLPTNDVTFEGSSPFVSSQQSQNRFNFKVFTLEGNIYCAGKTILASVTARAQWIRQHISTCGPGLNPEHNIYTFYNLYLNCDLKRTKIIKKMAGLVHI